MSELLEIAVVIPTFNERENVATLIARLDAALAGRRWEAIFVDDDSPDGTADAARAFARVDRRVRVLQRIGRRGLSSACIEGMCVTAAPVVAVMDGDLQHDETLLPVMLDAIAGGEVEVAIGSRFVAGGGTGEWDRDRVAKSAIATKLSRRVLRADLSDPMSGFFAIRADVLRALVPRLSGIGFKILLDIMTASPRPLVFRELPYTFRVREGREQARSRRGDGISDRAVRPHVRAARAGAFRDVFRHRCARCRRSPGRRLAVLPRGRHRLRRRHRRRYDRGDDVQLFLTNSLTYRDRRLSGARQLLDGWFSFCIVCSVGAAANVGMAAFLHEVHQGGWATSALVGILVAAVWNFALSSRFTWGRYQ